MKINHPESLGKLIRDERKSQDLRQSDLAAAVGVGVVFLSDLENGKPTAEMGKVIKVLHGLSLDLIVKKR